MRQKKTFLLFPCLILTFVFLVLACSGDDDEAKLNDEEVAMSIQLTSSAFAEGESIPAQYTCTGEDISPLLEWSNIPQDTQSFALIMDDPDAPSGTWVHWLVYNLPAETLSLPEAVLSDAKLPGGGAQGRNSWNRLG
jgi:phosphatidylethanolamine-binding protein (PEBP) family uncharacterized protein